MVAIPACGDRGLRAGGVGPARSLRGSPASGRLRAVPGLAARTTCRTVAAGLGLAGCGFAGLGAVPWPGLGRGRTGRLQVRRLQRRRFLGGRQPAKQRTTDIGPHRHQDGHPTFVPIRVTSRGDRNASTSLIGRSCLERSAFLPKSPHLAVPGGHEKDRPAEPPIEPHPRLARPLFEPVRLDRMMLIDFLRRKLD